MENEIVQICGHCGGEVSQGFNVCSGCGAHSRRNFKGVGLCLLIFILSLGYIIDYGSFGDIKSILIPILVMIVVGYFGKNNFQKRWYRLNA